MTRSNYLNSISFAPGECEAAMAISSALYTAFRDSAYPVFLAKPQQPIEEQIAEARASGSDFLGSWGLGCDPKAAAFKAEMEATLANDDTARQFVQQANTEMAELGANGSANDFVRLVSADISRARGLNRDAGIVEVTEQELRPGAFSQPSESWNALCAKVGQRYELTSVEADQIVCGAFAKLAESGQDVMLSSNLKATQAVIKSALARKYGQD